MNRYLEHEPAWQLDPSKHNLYLCVWRMVLLGCVTGFALLGAIVTSGETAPSSLVRIAITAHVFAFAGAALLAGLRPITSHRWWGMLAVGVWLLALTPCLNFIVHAWSGGLDHARGVWPAGIEAGALNLVSFGMNTVGALLVTWVALWHSIARSRR